MKEVFNRFRRWLAALLLPDDLPPLASATSANETVAVTVQDPPSFTPIAAQPGLVCPQCSTKIAITIPMLLSGQPFYCTGCFLEISVNQTESATALNALNKLQGEFQKAEVIVKSSKL
jgi:hypothetical protein